MVSEYDVYYSGAEEMAISLTQDKGVRNFNVALGGIHFYRFSSLRLSHPADAAGQCGGGHTKTNAEVYLFRLSRPILSEVAVSPWGSRRLWNTATILSS